MTRPTRQRKALFAAVVVLPLAAAACSTATRYEVLCFFFDGVPPPPGVAVAAPQIPEARAPSTFAEGLMRLREARPRSKPGPVIRSVHKPVLEQRCTECHASALDVADMPRDARLCDRCHLEQREKEGWNHGPVNLGTCIPCHVAHRSPNDHLLTKPVPDLCLNCHVGVEQGAPQYHDVENFADCIACHDPHRMY